MKLSKKAAYAHIMADGTIRVFDKYKDPRKNYADLYDEKILDEKMSIRCEKGWGQSDTDFKYSHIYLGERVVNLLPMIERIEIWPHNEGAEAAAKGTLIQSVILICQKNITLSFDKITMCGQTRGNIDVSICY